MTFKDTNAETVGDILGLSPAEKLRQRRRSLVRYGERLLNTVEEANIRGERIPPTVSALLRQYAHLCGVPQDEVPQIGPVKAPKAHDLMMTAWWYLLRPDKFDDNIQEEDWVHSFST